jgi:DNA-binding NtrC family response regulator
LKGKVFVIDDEPLMLQFMEKQLGMNGYEVSVFNNPPAALDALAKQGADLVISDVKMPEMTGDEVLRHIRQFHPTTGVVLVTGFGSINHAVNAVQNGAFDYITKPFSGAEILARVNRFFKVKERSGDVVAAPSLSGPKAGSIAADPVSEKETKSSGIRYEVKLIGNNPKIQRLLDALPQIAQNAAPVLIQGESGSGKEVLASLIHYNSDRADGPYVKINCANLPSELVESTLFGHVKGAFTGAITDAKGAFDEAQGGTLLLDEITEIDLPVQAKLLRVLQEKEFRRVGSQKTLKTDVRIIATTNRAIGQTIKEGKFRQDLYYRLNVFPIEIPPLRERKEDIPALATYFCEKYALEYRLGTKILAEDTMDFVKRQEWRGNVRELENVIQRGVLMSMHSQEVRLEHIQNPLFRNVDDSMETEAELPLVPIEEMELKMIKMALDRTNGNQKEAADLLGISDRTIRNKLKKIKGEYADDEDAGDEL